MDEEVKPCPFCGDKPMHYPIAPHKHSLSWVPDHLGCYVIECPCCSLQLVKDTEEQALAAWNQRASEKAPPERLRVRRLGLGDTTQDGAFYPVIDGRAFGMGGRAFWPTEDEARQIGERILQMMDAHTSEARDK